MWIDVRRCGKLLFRYNPIKRLIEIRVRGETVTIDLDDYVPQSEITEPVDIYASLC